MHKEIVQQKTDLFGPDHYNLCVSLSGLAEAYLSLKDFKNARAEAKRMEIIAQLNEDDEQGEIACELLHEINKVCLH